MLLFVTRVFGDSDFLKKNHETMKDVTHTTVGPLKRTGTWGQVHTKRTWSISTNSHGWNHEIFLGKHHM